MREQHKRGGIVILVVVTLLVMLLLHDVAFTGLVIEDATIENITESHILWSGREDVFVIPLRENISLDLRAYIEQRDGLEITFLVTETENISVDIVGAVLTIIPDEGYLGEGTLTLIASDNISIFRKSITVQVGGVEKTKTVLPAGMVRFSLRNKADLSVGRIEQEENTDGSLELVLSDKAISGISTAESAENKVALHKVRALQEEIVAKFGDVDNEEITTSVFAVKDIEVENAEITLEKQGEVNTIFRCPDFDQNTFSCADWEKTNIGFTDNGDTITFTVDGFSGFGGGLSTQSTPGFISSCQELDTSGIYTLTAGVSSSGNCFNINVSDVELDCAGFTITYGNTSTGIGINVSSSSALTNVTVKNCNIIKGTTVSNSDNYGIRLFDTSLSVIKNNTISTNGTSTNLGILLDSSSNNNITGTNISPSGSTFNNRGISLQSNANFNTISGVTISTNGTGGNNGIFLSSSSNNNIASINISASGSQGSNRGILLQSNSNSNTISSTTISTRGTNTNSGIFLSVSSNNNITSTNISASGTQGTNRGISLSGSSNFNTISSVTISTNGDNNNKGRSISRNIIVFNHRQRSVKQPYSKIITITNISTFDNITILNSNISQSTRRTNINTNSCTSISIRNRKPFTIKLSITHINIKAGS